MFKKQKIKIFRSKNIAFVSWNFAKKKCFFSPKKQFLSHISIHLFFHNFLMISSFKLNKKSTKKGIFT